MLLRFLLIALVFGAAPAWAQSGKKANSRPIDPASLPACPSDARIVETSLTCRCDTGGSLGSVWGSGPYTADSDICTAATHAGVIGSAGGAVQIAIQPGQSSYSGTSQNGVTTREWGAYDTSFAARRPSGSGDAVRLGASGLPVCDTIPDDAEFHSCRCDANAPEGSVWGSGPFTADSDICTAARHAGYIDVAGGDIHVIRVAGLGSYAGQESFGINSSAWGSYHSSIVFDWNR